MNPLDVQNDIREYDILMHGGAPQVPAPVFGREPKAYRQGRTARCQPMEFVDDGGEEETLYYIVFDCSTGGVAIKPAGGEEQAL